MSERVPEHIIAFNRSFFALSEFSSSVVLFKQLISKLISYWINPLSVYYEFLKNASQKKQLPYKYLISPSLQFSLRH